MYYIAYKDPMTGALLEVKAESLTDAVSAIQKAKDDLYYRGHAPQTGSSPSVENDDDAPDENHTSADADETEINADEPDADNADEDDTDEEEFLYPYGVTLW